MTSEITLEAALRDYRHDKADVRNIAIRNLAPALLQRLDLQPPLWNLGHPAEPERTPKSAELIQQVIEALKTSVHDARYAPNQGLALIALGQLGMLDTVELANHWIEQIQDDKDASLFLRESAMIALSFIGRAAKDLLETPPHSRETSEIQLARQCYQEIRARFEDAIHSPFIDLRFQAGPALVDILQGDAVPFIVAALETEQEQEVRKNHLHALTLLDPPSPVACNTLAHQLAHSTPEMRGLLGFEAALALTTANRHEAGPRLIEALLTREYRDRALEALAVLGEQSPENSTKKIEKIANNWLFSGMTRVRAAYALARISPPRGQHWLNRFAKSLRPSIRQAVMEARANLSLLNKEDPAQEDPYRQ